MRSMIRTGGIRANVSGNMDRSRDESWGLEISKRRLDLFTFSGRIHTENAHTFKSIYEVCHSEMEIGTRSLGLPEFYPLGPPPSPTRYKFGRAHALLSWGTFACGPRLGSVAFVGANFGPLWILKETSFSLDWNIRKGFFMYLCPSSLRGEIIFM